MNLSLEGKNAVICGSSQGIGFAIAEELAIMGANCILLARNEENLKIAVYSLDTSIRQAHSFHAVDFNNQRTQQKILINEIAETQPVHILINNSGGPAAGPITEATEEQFLHAFNQHLLPIIFLPKLLSKE